MANEEKPGGKGQEQGSSQTPAEWEKEDAYWREKHGSQAYADKSRSYEDYAPAYRVAVEGAGKHGARNWEEIETKLQDEYEQIDRAALPWDMARPAVRAAWDRVSGVISPRDFDRGIRGSI